MAFRNKKVKTVSMDNHMQTNGINVKEKQQFKAEVENAIKKVKTPTNSDTHYTGNYHRQKISKSEWIRFLTQIDMRQWCSILLWENVPNGIPSWLINQMAYYRGSLAGFVWNNGFYILPYALKGGLNPYGLPTGITPISYNGTVDAKTTAFEKNFSCNINNAGNYDPNATAVLYYSSMPYIQSGIPLAPYAVNSVVIEQMAEILSRIVIQIVVTNHKIIIKTQDPKQQENLLRQLEKAFDSDSPFIVVAGDDQLQTIEIQPNSSTNASDFWIHFKGFNDLKNASNGIENGGYFQKKERKNTSESESDTAGTSLCLTDRLYFAQEFVKNCKEQFKDIEGMDKFSVRFNEELEVQEGVYGDGNADSDSEETESESEENEPMN